MRGGIASQRRLELACDGDEASTATFIYTQTQHPVTGEAGQLVFLCVRELQKSGGGPSVGSIDIEAEGASRVAFLPCSPPFETQHITWVGPAQKRKKQKRAGT